MEHFLIKSIDGDMSTGIYASCAHELKALINPVFLSKTITATPALDCAFNIKVMKEANRYLERQLLSDTHYHSITRRHQA